MEIQPKILLVDDEPDILEILEYNLRKEGYLVFTANNGKEAIEKAKFLKPQLIIMDIMMPEMDGIEACSLMRMVPELSNVTIAFLTARTEEYSQIAGFNAGADDFIAKPIKPILFVTRVKALLRRVDGNAVMLQRLKVKAVDLKIDRDRYLVFKNDVEYFLPRKQFEFLALLASKPQKVFTREEILETVWGKEVIVNERTIDVHIRKIREKLGDDIVKTIVGVGYRMDQ